MSISRYTSTIIVLLLWLLGSSLLSAQSGTVRGTVREESGDGVTGAAVRVEVTKLGALSKQGGSFEITGVPAGEYWVNATLLGYESARQRIVVQAGGTTEVTLTLRESTIELGEVEVIGSGKRQDASDVRSSVTKIEPRESKYLPGAGEDVMRSLRSLPGVLAPNDFSSQLIVRGSGPDQNLIVLDDIEVFNPYRLYGFVSMFNPETIADITLLSGGFPARYGDRLSAVLDVTNREGERSDAILGKVNASITNANLVLEGSLPGSLRGGWLLSGRRTYYDLIAGPILRSMKVVEGDVALPNFRDLQFKALARPWDEHSFVVNALTSRDGTELTSSAERDRVDSFSVVDRSYNSLLGLAWRYTPGSNALVKTIVSWYENTGETQFGGDGGGRLLYGDLTRDSVIKLIRSLPPAIQDSLRARGINPDNPPALGIDDGNASFSFRKYTFRNESSLNVGDHLIEVGAGVDLIRNVIEFSAQSDSLLRALRNTQRRAGFPDSVSSIGDYYRLHAYAQDRINFGDRLYLQLGGRYDYYRLIDRGYFSPRINASFVIDPITTVRGAFGIYYQSPGYEKLIDGQTFYDLLAPEVQDLEAERAMHWVFGFDRMVSEEWQVKVEGYYKRFSNLIVQQKLSGINYRSEPREGGNLRYPSGWTRPVGIPGDSVTSVPVNGATGEAYGVEFLLQKIGSARDSKLNGWVSYALAWANRYRDGRTFPFNFDQRHTVNVVLNYRVNDWLELGSMFQFGSGYPYTPAIDFGPIILVNNDSTGEQRMSFATNIFGEALFRINRGGPENINSARLPAYHRLDLRATFYTKWWNLDWALYLDVINVYNHTNLLSRSFYVDRSTTTMKTREVSMFPILPTVGLSVRF